MSASTDPAAPEAAELAFPFERRCPFDPPEEVARLREEQPVSRVRLFDGQLAWLLTRYLDVRAACTDARLSSDTTKDGYPEVFSGRKKPSEKERSLISMDDPKHSEIRRMLTRWFTVKRAEQMRPRIADLVNELLDGLEETGPPGDLVSGFAQPIPTAVICWLLGVPVEDHEFFQAHAGTRLTVTAAASDVSSATTELMDYLSELLARKEREPADDIMSDLAHRWIPTGAISREESVDLARVLLIAGHESTASMIALSTALLIEYPDQLARLKADPSLINEAVEEMLRFLTIPQLLVGRVATEDLVLGGQLISEGEGVRALINSANRDPRAFPNPDAFDIERQARHHVAFGFGVHQCLGQPYARIEMQEAIGAVVARFPKIALDRSVDDLPFKYHSAVHGISELPITW